MPPRNFTDQEEAEIAKIYLDGRSAKSIARAYGLSHHISICAALGRQGVRQRSPAERNRLYKLNPCVFDVIDNEHTAYWWGFIYADGCVSRRTLIVALKWSDKDHLEKLKDFMQSDSPIKARICTIGTSLEKYHNAEISFTDRYLAARLQELGIIAHRIEFHAVAKNLPHDLEHHWIRGFFDGDGSARKNSMGGLEFCGQEKLLEWIREVMAREADTNPNLMLSRIKHAPSIRYLRYSGRVQALKTADYMYRDATVWLDRKREVINSWPQKRGRILPPQCRKRGE